MCCTRVVWLGCARAPVDVVDVHSLQIFVERLERLERLHRLAISFRWHSHYVKSRTCVNGNCSRVNHRQSLARHLPSLRHAVLRRSSASDGGSGSDHLPERGHPRVPAQPGPRWLTRRWTSRYRGCRQKKALKAAKRREWAAWMQLRDQCAEVLPAIAAAAVGLAGWLSFSTSGQIANAGSTRIMPRDKIILIP